LSLSLSPFGRLLLTNYGFLRILFLSCFIPGNPGRD